MSYPYLAIHEKKSLSNVQTNKHQVIYSRTNHTRRNRRRDSDPSRDVVVTALLLLLLVLGLSYLIFVQRTQNRVRSPPVKPVKSPAQWCTYLMEEGGPGNQKNKKK